MIYSLIFLLILFGFFHFDLLKNKFGKHNYTLIVFILLGLMSAFRYRVGGDSIVYESWFEEIPNLNNIVNYIQNQNTKGLMPLWIFLNSIVKNFGGDVYDFQFLHALIFNSFLFVFLKRNTKYIFTFLLFFFTFLLYFYFSFEIQRESLAVAVFLLNLKNLQNKKWSSYYFLAVISFLFHVSAIVIFIIPLFNYIKFNKKVLIIIAIIGLPLSLLKETFVNLFSSLLFLESMKSRAEIYSQANFSLIGLVSFYIVRVIIPLPFIFTLINKTDKRNGILLGFVIFSIFAQIIVGFERFLNYFYIWLIVQFINEIYNIDFKKISIVKRNFFKMSFILMLYFIIAYKLFGTDKYGNYYYSIFFPYESKFDKQINVERENYIQNLWGW